MADMTKTAEEMFIAGLRNQHAVERQAVELLERQAERIENYPTMAARLRQHITESRAQAARLEELLGQHGTSASTVKDTVMSVVGNVAALSHAAATDEVLKNTLANYAFEHFEIASYRSLLELASLAGRDEAKAALTTSLHEEEAMAAWIDEHLAPTVRDHVARRAAGERADR